MRVIFIDARNQKVEEKEITGDTLKALQSCVEGYIEKAMDLDNHDSIYVNEEGLFQSWDHYFIVDEDPNRIFVGNGVVSGVNPRTGDTRPVLSDLSEIEKRIKFMDGHDVRSLLSLINKAK